MPHIPQRKQKVLTSDGFMLQKRESIKKQPRKFEFLPFKGQRSNVNLKGSIRI